MPAKRENARPAGELVGGLKRDTVCLHQLGQPKVVGTYAIDAVPGSRVTRRWVGVALAAVVLLSTWGLGSANRSTVADIRGSINGAEFMGRIKPSQRSTLTAISGGTVQRLLVAVGENVTMGQPLIEMDDPTARAALDGARLDYQSATTETAHWQRSIADLDRSIQEVSTAFAQSLGAVAIAQRQADQVPGRQFRDSPERAQAVFDQESNRLQRMRKLHGLLLLSNEQLEEQITAVRIAQNDLENANQWRAASAELQRAQQDQARQQIARSRAESQQLRADYVARLDLAKARADQAQQRVDAAERTIGESIVRAATGGVVVDIAVDVGNRPSAGTPLVTIAKLNELLVEVPVSPKLINILQVGQAATVTLPTMPPQQVEGRIGSINPIPAANMTHAVEIQFANASGHLLTGQPAQVVFR